ncbi:hypothetical protein J5N97_019200 [Dioscorea zingiberensis]|uniref:MAPK kinase substrate protein n=1 Tax=Dioscorea zingiberensis TaxID=325984 RepID=A0A9D5CDG7_9LILI|nr:hypothetical protein J5N97_019200 [Dioscorea zingiberensis]
MAGLQRSVETFRRSGSSGLVWEDRFLEEMDNSSKEKQQKKEAEEGLELRRSRSVGSGGVMERSQSNGGRGRGYRTGSVSPALDPPSPKVSACGFCGVFGKSGPSKKPKTGSRPSSLTVQQGPRVKT